MCKQRKESFGLRLTFVGAEPCFCLKRVRLEKAYENFGNWWQNLLRVMTGNSVERIKSIFSCNFSIAKFRRQTQNLVHEFGIFAKINLCEAASVRELRCSLNLLM